ncbi:hypothetical protein Asfd1_26 [Aeromonas phage Asfd_1]|nr:hypothetical protein Asfd1_26 [Aeromonas phage Asfd_1]
MFDLNDLMGGSDEPSTDGVNIIDASQLIIATILTNATPKDINEKMIRHLVLDTMRNNVKKFRKDYPETIVAFDDSTNGYWRRDIAHYYKHNRKVAKEASEWDWDLLFTIINKIVGEMLLIYPNVKMIKIDKTEADDIIAILTKRFTEQGRRVMISSSDGDFTQLQKYKGVKQYSPAQKKEVKPKYGSPRHDLIVKIVKGDKKDGVSSIKVRNTFYHDKVDGERSPPCATKWINMLAESDDPRSALENEEWQKRWDENVQLIDFDAIPDFVSQRINETYNVTTTNPRGKLYSYFVKNQLVNLLKKINEF